MDKEIVSRQTLWNWKKGKGLPTLANLKALKEKGVDTEVYAKLAIKAYSDFLTNKKVVYIEEA